jgi:arylsulfatase A-like enzyme
MRRKSRREFLKALGAGAVAGAFPAAAASGRSVTRPKRPNFLFILVDDLGWADLSCYGSTFHETPHLDKLAASAVRFTDAYAAHPVCSPTRAAIMTGKNPARIGITDWIPGSNPRDRKLLGPSDKHRLALEEVTLAEALKRGGYRTFFAGKWHLCAAGDKSFHPEDQGFEINKGGHHRGSPPGGYYTPYKNPKLTDGAEGEYLTDRLTDETIGFMSRHRDGPFLAYLSFYTVHTPIQACKRHGAKFAAKRAKLPPLTGPAHTREHDGWTQMRQDNAAYATMVHAMDENVGRLLKALDRLGLAKDTVVIFTSDNGGRSTLQGKGNPTCNLPLRAGKGWCYEGGIRVPLIVRAPGVSKGGATCSVPVNSADFYPTILEFAHLPLMPAQHADGASLTPLLKGATKLDREFIVWHYPHYHGSAWTPGSAIRAGDWKLIKFYDKQKVELYNLRRDVGETRELSGEHPDKAKQLLARLEEYLTDVNAPMPTANPDPKGKPRRR